MKEKTNPNPYLSLMIEIRRRVIIILLIFIVAATFGVIKYEKIIKFFLHLLNLEEATIVFSSPFEYMNLALSCGLITGSVTVLPFFFYQLISFLKPALTKKEFIIFRRYVPFSLVLFITGFGVGFWIIKYVSYLSFQAAKNLGVTSFLNVSHLLSITLLTGVLMGIAFQFPLILILLIRFNIVSRRFLVDKRPFAYIIAIVFASLMPPTDILSLIILTIPLVILYEFVLIFTR